MEIYNYIITPKVAGLQNRTQVVKYGLKEYDGQDVAKPVSKFQFVWTVPSKFFVRGLQFASPPIHYSMDSAHAPWIITVEATEDGYDLRAEGDVVHPYLQISLGFGLMMNNASNVSTVGNVRNKWAVVNPRIFTLSFGKHTLMGHQLPKSSIIDNGERYIIIEMDLPLKLMNIKVQEIHGVNYIPSARFYPHNTLMSQALSAAMDKAKTVAKRPDSIKLRADCIIYYGPFPIFSVAEIRGIDNHIIWSGDGNFLLPRQVSDTDLEVFNNSYFPIDDKSPPAYDDDDYETDYLRDETSVKSVNTTVLKKEVADNIKVFELCESVMAASEIPMTGFRASVSEANREAVSYLSYLKDESTTATFLNVLSSRYETLLSHLPKPIEMKSYLTKYVFPLFLEKINDNHPRNVRLLTRSKAISSAAIPLPDVEETYVNNLFATNNVFTRYSTPSTTPPTTPKTPRIDITEVVTTISTRRRRPSSFSDDDASSMSDTELPTTGADYTDPPTTGADSADPPTTDAATADLSSADHLSTADATETKSIQVDE